MGFLLYVGMNGFAGKARFHRVKILALNIVPGNCPLLHARLH